MSGDDDTQAVTWETRPNAVARDTSDAVNFQLQLVSMSLLEGLIKKGG